MTDQEILEGLSGILSDLLADQSLQLTMNTRRDDVPGWDSFANISFMVAVEQKFGVKFSVVDVESFETVGEIVRRLHETMR